MSDRNKPRPFFFLCPLRSSRLDLAALTVALLMGALLASCGPAIAPTAAGAPHAARAVSSNVLFADYAGTQACAKCHADKVEAWLRAPMHNMTREPSLAEIHGPFDGTTFTFKEDTARLETVGGARFITLASKRFGSGIYRLTRIIGGHHREDYAGIAVASARADAAPVTDPPEELVLPVSWVFASTPGAQG